MDKLKDSFTGYLFVIQLPSPRSAKKNTCRLELKKTNNLIGFYFYEILLILLSLSILKKYVTLKKKSHIF